MIKKTSIILLIVLFLPIVCLAQGRGYIAYIHNDDIWIIDTEGQNPRQITKLNDVNTKLSWSPDNTRIVFSREQNILIDNLDGTKKRQTTNDLWFVSNDGINLFQITNDGCSSSPYWHSKKNLITFDYEKKNPDGLSEFMIGLIKNDGSGKKILDVQGFNPSFIKNGERIGFHFFNDRKTCLAEIDLEGNNYKKLQEFDQELEEFSWSHQGDSIVYRSIENEKDILVLLNLETGVVEKIFDNPENLKIDEIGNWSADDSSIVFVMDDQIYTLNLLNSIIIQLTNEGINSSPRWNH